MISCCALLQLLLGNIGRPAAGSSPSAATPRSRARPTSPRCTTRSTATSPPRREEEARDAREYLETEKKKTGYWSKKPAFLVSYLKSMYGAPP